MPVSQTHHPEMEQLTAFGLGLLSDADSAEIELHLSDCAACCEKLEYLPADSLVDLLQAAEADTPSDLSHANQTVDSSLPASAPASLPPLYKKLANIVTGKPAGEPVQPSPAKVAAFYSGKIPTELAGHSRYEVLEPLGAGGMGAVYKARHRLMDRVVALKIVNPLLVTKPGAVDRFIREVKAAAQLTHPNIVTAYDAEQVGEMHVLVMEYVEGETLAEMLQQQGVLAVAQACDYVRQTALGLQHAVDRGMVHRDVKPLNLMLTPRKEVKILDFGLARFVSEQTPLDGTTEHGSMMGSPDYMAPEQARDAHTADARADIYSMGCTLYQLLAGQVPFPGLAMLEKLEAHRDQQPPALNEIRVDVPADLERIIAKMMAKDPDQRYQTPAEVAEALLPFTQARRTHAPLDAKPSKPAVERKPKSKLPVAMAIVAALLLVGFGYWAAQVVLRVETPQGTLIVTTDDPDVQISVKSGGKEVALFFPQQKKEVQLEIGAYTLELVGGKDGMKLSTNKFEIKSGNDEKTVTVEFVPTVAEKKTPNSVEKVETQAGFSLPEIPGAEELLKTREVLTVAQDGSGGYKTLDEAFKNVQTGQAINVLDKGPYREFISITLPADVALVSLVGTRIEIPKYTDYAPGPKEGERWYFGASINVQGSFRLSGFEWVGPATPRPENFYYGTLLHLGATGDTVVERCSFQAPDYLIGLRFFNLSDKAARLVVQDNVSNQCLEFLPFPGSLTVQRNWITSPRIGMSFDQRAGSVLIRNNIVNAYWAISFNQIPVDKAPSAPGVDLTIHNNVLETGHVPIGFWNEPKATRVLPRSVWIANNILRSRTNDGVLLIPVDRELVKDRWNIGPNAYQTEPKKEQASTQGAIHVSWPIGPGDQILPKHFLSVEPNNADYLRIAADCPLATGGAGGDLPTYFGAFPPGPAPKAGDWFTELLAKESQKISAQTNPLPEFLPLKEYLKGREILTVSQDGTAMFTTINAAIDKLKPGQVIKILDKGPYREALNRDVPENVGLVSEVGTRIEITEWGKSGAAGANKFNYFGLVLRCPRNLRLSGFEIVSPKLKLDAEITASLILIADGDITLESSRLLHTPRYGMTPPPTDDLAFSPIRVDVLSWTDEGGRVAVHDNHLECALLLNKPGAAIAVQRNHIAGWVIDGIHVWTASKPREVVIRDNFIQGHYGVRFDGRETTSELWGNVPVTITNNVLDTVSHPVSFFAGDEAKKGWCPREVHIHNNIFRSQEHGGIVLTAKGLSEVKAAWLVSHNCYYQNEPGSIGGLAVFPKQPADLIEVDPLISLKPGEAGFLRIVADGRLATGGVGGNLPSYIGPLPPGPAPKEGDWFTRLQEVSKDKE